MKFFYRLLFKSIQEKRWGGGGVQATGHTKKSNFHTPYRFLGVHTSMTMSAIEHIQSLLLLLLKIKYSEIRHTPLEKGQRSQLYVSLMTAKAGRLVRSCCLVVAAWCFSKITVSEQII